MKIKVIRARRLVEHIAIVAAITGMLTCSLAITFAHGLSRAAQLTFDGLGITFCAMLFWLMCHILIRDTKVTK